MMDKVFSLIAQTKYFDEPDAMPQNFVDNDNRMKMS